MIRTTLTLHAANGEIEPIVEYFLREQVLERSAQTPGFRSSELLQPVNGGPLFVTAAWDNAAAYQRWLDNPWRAESNALLLPLLDEQLQSTITGTLYRLRHGIGSVQHSQIRP